MYTHTATATRKIEQISTKDCNSTQVHFAIRCIVSRVHSRGAEPVTSSPNSTNSCTPAQKCINMLSFWLFTQQGIFSILRDKATTRQDFIFFTDRLSTLLVEHALQHLPYAPKTVTTPVGVEAHGKTMNAEAWLLILITAAQLTSLFSPFAALLSYALGVP